MSRSITHHHQLLRLASIYLSIYVSMYVSMYVCMYVCRAFFVWVRVGTAYLEMKMTKV